MNKKKKVLFLSAAPFIGGGEINLISLLSTIDKDIFDCHLLYNPKSSLEKYIYGLNISKFDFPEYRINNCVKVYISFVRMLFLILINRFDCIYVNTIIALKAYWPIFCCLRIPVIAHIHILEKDESMRWLKINRAKRIIVCSKFLKNCMMNESSWLDRGKIYVLHNAIEKEIWQPSSKNFLRSKYSIEKDIPIVGIVGQIKKIKGQKIFIEMVKKLSNNRVVAKYFIVGESSANDHKYKMELERLIAKYDLSKQIIFTGFLNNIPQIMSDLDLLVVPSSREPFGRVVIESLACGTPVLASKVGGIPEILNDRKGGLFFDVGNSDDLADKAQKFFNNRDWWNDQKLIAYQSVFNKFDQMEHTDRIQNHLLEIISNHKK